jgi:DNA-directed RNA polymerase II subunit RPB3
MVRPSRASARRLPLFRGAASRLQRALCNLDKMAPASRPAAIDVSQSKNQYELNFSLTGTDVSVANAIRRTMIAEVPTMAIELVTVKENTSALHDEYIAHRLGLIPLVSTRADEFQFARDCGCEDHCPKCSVVFVLNEMFGNDGDSSVEGDTMIVNSKHLKNMYDSKELCETVVPVHSSGDFEQASTGADGQVFGITITKLARGQKIHMEMIARKGIGKEHAKWSPMCTVSYRILPPAVELLLTRINEIFSAQRETKRAIVEASEGLLSLDGEDLLAYEKPFLEGRIGVTQDTVRFVSQAAIESGYSAADVIKMNPKPKRFDFSAETTGAMPPALALKIAIEILQKKLSDVHAHLLE